MAERVEYFNRGAEAVLYRVRILGSDLIVKKRLDKPYRHEAFNKVFKEYRTRVEARILSHLRSLGLNVPAPLIVDVSKGILVLEYVEGTPLSRLVDSMSSEERGRVAGELGRQVAVMHSNRIYHGDLTLANTIYSGGRVYIIDFGLAGYSDDVEEYAIDLHLLYRNLQAMHPGIAEEFMNQFLENYRQWYSGVFEEVRKRFLEVRVRGRYVDRELRKTVMRDRYVS
ncbi:Kae1-associated kinase Bud32 [Thermosphaera chiliense]|uniref:non-specific serine/threonine protein kinase n=1 Tax=Thermosphaera chiliense TaxID=3402707 RepID=A0A7M1UR80_9CREN|nr:Kae1-associated kinase Bud32 [Thermosphaera aggregans]QOR94479.1 Kae1-associated kinase Bud32 [Thermosphaera aggregans]